MQTTTMSVGMMVAASGEMSGGDNCDGCSGEKGMSAAQCYAVCNLQLAILSVPLSAAAVPADKTHFVVSLPMIGGTVLPEPFPPKPVVLI